MSNSKTPFDIVCELFAAEGRTHSFAVSNMLAATSKRAPKPRYWTGNPGHECNVCHQNWGKTFVDGATSMGPWANMCTECHRRYGRGLGEGKGQRYEKQPDGRWLKTGG